MTVTVFSKPSCPQCVNTKKMLTSMGLEFKEDSLIENQEARDNFVSMGYMSAPIVEVAQEDGSVQRWAGFIPEMIKGLKVA